MPGHLRGAMRLGDLVERQKALAGALMGSTRRRVPQVFLRLAPTGMVNVQHGRGR